MPTSQTAAVKVGCYAHHCTNTHDFDVNTAIQRISSHCRSNRPVKRSFTSNHDEVDESQIITRDHTEIRLQYSSGIPEFWPPFRVRFGNEVNRKVTRFSYWWLTKKASSQFWSTQCRKLHKILYKPPKKNLTFHCIGCLIGILIMAHSDPHITA